MSSKFRVLNLSLALAITALLSSGCEQNSSLIKSALFSENAAQAESQAQPQLEGELTPFFREIRTSLESTQSKNLTKAEAHSLSGSIQRKLKTLLEIKNEKSYKNLFQEMNEIAKLSHRIIGFQKEREVQVELALLWNEILDFESVLRSVFSARLNSEVKAVLESRKFENLQKFVEQIVELRSPYSILEEIDKNMVPEKLESGELDKSKVYTAEERLKLYQFILDIGALGQIPWYFTSYLIHKDFVENPTADFLKFMQPEATPYMYIFNEYRRSWGEVVEDNPSPSEKAMEKLSKAISKVIGEENGEKFMDYAWLVKNTLGHFAPEKQQEESDKYDKIEKEFKDLLSGERTAAFEKLKQQGVDVTEAQLRYTQGQKGTLDENGWSFKSGEFILREGDVVILKGESEWDALTNSPLRFSHFKTVTFDKDGFPFTFDNFLSPSAINSTTFVDYDAVILRNRELGISEREKLRGAVESFLKQGKLPYDVLFNAKDDSKLYCSELGYHLYRRAGLNADFPSFQGRNERISNWMSELGLENHDFYITQSSYILDSRFDLVGSNASGGYISWSVPRKYAIDSVVRKLGSSRKADFSKVQGGYWKSMLQNILKGFAPDEGIRKSSFALSAAYLNLSAGILSVSNAAKAKVEERGIVLTDDYLLYVEALQEETEKATDLVFKDVFVF